MNRKTQQDVSLRLDELPLREKKIIVRQARAWREQDAKSSHDKLQPFEHYVQRVLEGKTQRLGAKTPSQLQDDKGWFVCTQCGDKVANGGGGTVHRNHCPWCLHSLHLDVEPGDRSAECGGVMEPVAVWVRKGGEWALIHRCKACGTLGSNRIAADDNAALLLSLAARPLAAPPFPLDRLR